jgi:FkbM family methyltransferase
MRIFYGTLGKYIDITQCCKDKLMNNGIINIPPNDDLRAGYFTDPVYGKLKQITVEAEDKSLVEYDHTKTIIINTETYQVTCISDEEINQKLADIHKKLQIKYGDFNYELPEQRMVVRYLTGKEKVLEIGGNVGRNSLIISSILSENGGRDNNLVTLECDENIAKQLTENRELNNFKFHIENSALSKRNLIQKGWDTIESDVVLDGYKPVKTITLQQLTDKYNIQFDTLVLDCEGAFYYILMDMPEILDNINLIIMENDYFDISKKKYIDEILRNNNFYVDYTEIGGWGPCYRNFFEVWKR